MCSRRAGVTTAHPGRHQATPCPQHDVVDEAGAADPGRHRHDGVRSHHRPPARAPRAPPMAMYSTCTSGESARTPAHARLDPRRRSVLRPARPRVPPAARALRPSALAVVLGVSRYALRLLSASPSASRTVGTTTSSSGQSRSRTICRISTDLLHVLLPEARPRPARPDGRAWPRPSARRRSGPAGRPVPPLGRRARARRGSRCAGGYIIRLVGTKSASTPRSPARRRSRGRSRG